MNCKNFIFFLLLTISTNLVFAVTIPYGKSGKIDYNLKTGTFNVFQGSKQLLTNGFSTAKNMQQLLSSKDYAQKTYSKIKISDRFGKGTKHIILLKGKGLPDMKQIFYTYELLPYFLCEVELSGTAVATNYMVPIQGTIISADEPANLRSLYVPFDNDTFISYDTKTLNAGSSNASAEVSSLYNNTSREGIVAGSVEHEVWKTGIKTSSIKGNNFLLEVLAGYTEPSLTRDTIAHGSIKGKTVSSPKVFFGGFQDWRTGMEDYAKANRIAEPPVVFPWKQPTPVGWNSWGVMQDKISFDKAVSVVDFFADSLKGFRNEGVAFIDLDSYWDKMIKGGLEGDYSQLKAFADYTKKKGLKPGVYWAPFTDWGFHGGPDRRAEGGNYKFGEMWTKVGKGYHDIDGARALDPTHPGTKARVALVIGKLKECGFEMIKIDFLGHAAVESEHFYNPEVTTGMQAYKYGMEYLIKDLDSKMLVYAAISPSMASGKYVHTRRIACDAFKSVKDTQYTLNSVTYGWWQTYLYDYLDADHVVLHDETEGANIARLLSAVVTGTVITGDDFSVHGQWSERAKKLYQNPQLLEVVKDGKSFRPVNGDEGKGASELFVKKVGNVSYLAVFNYGKSEKTFAADLARLGLQVNDNYKIEDLLTHKSEAFSKSSAIKVEAGNARIFKLTK